MSIIKQRLIALSILLTALGLCLPFYKQAYKYVRCDRQHIRAGFEIPPEIDDAPIPEQPEPEIQLPPELADNAEVILISGYESQKSDSDTVKVNINRPGKNVLLVLTSYEKVNWELETSPDTNITGVLIGSYHPSQVTNIDPYKVFPVDLLYSYELENKSFVDTVKQLHRWFGIERVDAFRGHYSLPNKIEVSQPDPIAPALSLEGYPVEKPANNFEFDLYDENYEPVEWTLTGASNDNSQTIYTTGIAVSPDRTQVYKITEEGIKVTDKNTGRQKEYKLPDKFPKLSWGTDIAYDSKRNLVSLVSLGGEGYFYRFDAEKRRWLDVRSVNNMDIQSLTYDRISDRYIAWAKDYGGYEDDLLFISGEGELLSKETVSDRLTGFYRQYDRDNNPTPIIEIVAQGNNIALMMRSYHIWQPEFSYSNRYSNPIHSIWHYDLDSQDIRLTYKSNSLP